MLITYVAEVPDNTYFTVSGSGDSFTISSSRYINRAEFTLIFQRTEYESVGGSTNYIDFEFLIRGPFDLSIPTNQNSITNIIQDYSNVERSSVNWTESGGIYSVTFQSARETVGIPPGAGSSELYLDGVKDVAAN
jgi:hypothetical protein